MSPGKPHLEQDRRGAQQVIATLPEVRSGWSLEHLSNAMRR
jgi:hypothetical protein